MRTEEIAKRMLRSKLKVAGRDTILCPWTEYGREQLAKLDMALYWVRFPGLPLQFYESLEKICDKLGHFVSVETPRMEVANGVPPVTCVQIADSEPLPRGVKLTRVPAGRGPKCWIQMVEYADMLHRCDRCKRQGHTHRQCAGEYVLETVKEVPSWAQVAARDPPRQQQHQQPNRTVEFINSDKQKGKEVRTGGKSAKEIHKANLVEFKQLKIPSSSRAMRSDVQSEPCTAKMGE